MATKEEIEVLLATKRSLVGQLRAVEVELAKPVREGKDETTAMQACGRCGLMVSSGACDVPPLVFHDRAEQCVEALKARVVKLEYALRAVRIRAVHECDMAGVKL